MAVNIALTGDIPLMSRDEEIGWILLGLQRPEPVAFVLAGAPGVGRPGWRRRSPGWLPGISPRPLRRTALVARRCAWPGAHLQQRWLPDAAGAASMAPRCR